MKRRNRTLPHLGPEESYVLLRKNGTIEGASDSGREIAEQQAFRLAVPALLEVPDGARVRIGGFLARVVRLRGDSGPLALVCLPSAEALGPAESALTISQREIARRAATGATVAEIARAIGRSSETVRSHLRDVYRRLGVASRIELARALNEGRQSVESARSKPARDETRKRR